VSRFGESVGVYPYSGPPDPELERERLLTLAAAADMFLRGGGCVSVTDWCSMDSEERAVFAAVGDKIQAKHAVGIATAARSVMGQATVMAVIDDGDELIRLHLTSLLDRMERRGAHE